MSFFSKKQSYLGIDLGTSSIKVVELMNVGGQAHLSTYGFAETPLDAVQFDIHQKVDRTAKTLQEICKRANTRGIKAVAALPTFVVFSSVLTLPRMNEKEVGQAIMYEAKKIIPLPIDDMVLHWKTLPDKAEPEVIRREKTMRVLLTAAPKNLVNQYMEIFRLAGLELLSLETEAFALGRALLQVDPAPAMLVDVGALTTDIAIVEDHIPVLNRSIDVGGVTVTKAIAQSLNIDERRAEQFKRDVGLVVGGSMSGVPKTVEVALSPMLNEIKYALSLYQTESPRFVQKIVLTGGSAFLPHVSEYLENIFQIKTFIGDPWASVVYPADLKGLLEELGPRMATAVGLALREIHA